MPARRPSRPNIGNKVGPGARKVGPGGRDRTEIINRGPGRRRGKTNDAWICGDGEGAGEEAEKQEEGGGGGGRGRGRGGGRGKPEPTQPSAPRTTTCVPRSMLLFRLGSFHNERKQKSFNTDKHQRKVSFLAGL